MKLQFDRKRERVGCKEVGPLCIKLNLVRDPLSKVFFEEIFFEKSSLSNKLDFTSLLEKDMGPDFVKRGSNEWKHCLIFKEEFLKQVDTSDTGGNTTCRSGADQSPVAWFRACAPHAPTVPHGTAPTRRRVRARPYSADLRSNFFRFVSLSTSQICNWFGLTLTRCPSTDFWLLFTRPITLR